MEIELIRIMPNSTTGKGNLYVISLEVRLFQVS